MVLWKQTATYIETFLQLPICPYFYIGLMAPNGLL